MTDTNFPLPCPCCGAKAFYVEGNPEIRQPDMIQCLDCDLELVGSIEKGSALEKWNKRANTIIARANTIIALQAQVAERADAYIMLKMVNNDLRNHSENTEIERDKLLTLLRRCRDVINDLDSIASGYRYRSGVPIERPIVKEIFEVIDPLLPYVSSKIQPL